MDILEKVDLINTILRKLNTTSLSSIPMLLDNKEIVETDLKSKYQIIERDLIMLDLVDVITSPGTNSTVDGFGEFTISAKGRELILTNTPIIELYD